MAAQAEAVGCEAHRFEVTPDVLVPRPETEFIVEEALMTTQIIDAIYASTKAGREVPVE